MTMEITGIDVSEIRDFNDSRLEYTTFKNAKAGIGSDRGSIAPSRQFVARKASSNANSISPFNNHLSIDSKDISVIHGIIRYLDSKNTFALGLPSNQKHLKEEGKKIDHVHPLCFIWSIVSNQELKGKLREFRDNSAFSLKWNGFLGYSSFHDKGFGKNMERYYNHCNINDCISEFEAFYHTLHLRADVMNTYAFAKDWAGFASALLEPSSYY